MHKIFELLAVTPTVRTGGTDIKEVKDDTPGLIPMVNSIVNGIIAVLGVACVVVMIIGGINYMTSTGDTQKVEKAKKTIIYGLIGLVICVLAFAIVNFVITNIIGGKSSSDTEETKKGKKDKEDASIILKEVALEETTFAKELPYVTNSTLFS